MARNARLLVVWWIGLLSVWIVNLSTVRSQNCPATGPAVGPGSGVPRAEYTTDKAIDSLFLIANPQYIGCYGVITTWSFRGAQDLDSPCYTSRAQIWRPSPPNAMEYLLVGENMLFDMDYCLDNLNSSANVNPFTVAVPPSSRIPVQPGDAIAWYDIGSGSTDRKIGFDSGLPASSDTIYVLPSDSTCISSSVGSGPCSWQTSSAVGRKYGIDVLLVAETRPPVLLNLPSLISIDELLPVGTFVFQVEASNKFTWNPTITPPLQYSMLYTSTPSCNASWFEIDPANGTITVANLFNVNPPTAPTFSCIVDVQVQQVDGPAIKNSLTVSVANINEPHLIDNLPQTVTFDSTSSNLLIYTVKFTDPDLDYFDTKYQKSFSIVDISPSYPPNPIFKIIPNAAGDGEVSATLSLNVWTGPNAFNISIILSDAQFVDGPKILTVILTNLIQPPVLTNLNATITLDETTATGPFIIYIVTSSTDSRASPPTYAILSEIPYSGVGPNTFAISSSTGSVTLNRALDYLAVKQYTIEIQAALKYSTTVTLFSKPGILTVNVKWIDSAPTINIAPPSPTVTVMSEDAAVGTPVPGITITANDREYDNNLGDYLVFFVSDPHFVVDNVTKVMYTSGSLLILPPNVCNQIYNLQVIARDSYGKVSNTLTLTVTVVRSNRASPTFSQEQFNGSVAENGVGGSPTGVRLTATDPDCGNNGTIGLHYSILDDLANLYFQVDPSSGDITQKQPISQPTYPNMTFTVMASDEGQPSLNSTAIVFIVVNATNANAPWFAEPYIEIETRSDSPVGSSIYTLNVTDPDSVLVNNINYQIIVVQDDFDVRSSGDIVPKRKLSSYKRYTLYVMANDTGQGMDYFTDPATVAIDTYDAANQLINIEMLRPLSETDPKLPDFIAKLNDFLKPWMVKMEDLRYDGDNTIVTIYAYDQVSTFSSEPTPKRFIDRDDLLAKMRTDIYGTPVEGLRGPEFEDYEIVSVDPAYPVWVLDTVEGIATLTVVCVVALVLIITAIVLLLKYFKLACFRQDKVGPAPQKTEPSKGESDLEEFQLSYANTQPLEPKTGDVKMFELEPFDRPPTYKANGPTPPPLRPDADLEL